jgi:hypothetical protein
VLAIFQPLHLVADSALKGSTRLLGFGGSCPVFTVLNPYPKHTGLKCDMWFADKDSAESSTALAPRSCLPSGLSEPQILI